MHVQTSTLPNGIRVITAKIPNFDTAVVAAFVNAGSRYETAEENGIAHFLEHMAFKGTTTRTAFDIADTVETLGSDINAFTSQNMTAYHVTGLGSNIRESVEIIGDIISNSIFDTEELEIERGVILQEIARSADDPNRVVYDIASNLAYPDQALGRPILGPPSIIKNVTRDNFVSFVNRFYYGDNIIVVSAGNVNHDEFVDMVADNFGGIRDGVGPSCAPALWRGGFGADNSDKFEQVTALIGWNSVSKLHPLVHANRMFSSAIGSGMSSPIFQEIREKRGLVYSVGTSHDAETDYGEFNLYAGTTADKLEELFKVARDVLQNSVKYITERDFLRARNTYLNNYATIKEKPFQLAHFLANKMFEKGKIVLPDEQKQLVLAVTKEDFVKSAEIIFESEPFVALVGPADLSVDYLGMMRCF